MRVIRSFARQVGKRFRPERIVLFGSHAYGRPHGDSDVDILVVMAARNSLAQAAGMKSLRQAGLMKVIEGTTTVEEVLRVTLS